MPVGGVRNEPNPQRACSQSPSPPQRRAAAEPDTQRTRLQSQEIAESPFANAGAKMEEAFTHLELKRHPQIAELVSHLDDQDPAVRENATRAIANLSTHADNQVPLCAQEGLVAGLVSHLDDQDPAVRRSATGAIANLSAHADNQALLCAQEGLVAGLRNNLNGTNLDVQILAHRALTILGIRVPANFDPQNTHLESINQSASTNAQMLRNHFPDADIDKAYFALTQYLQTLPTQGADLQDGVPNQEYRSSAAQEWIANPQHLEHRDETSGVSVKEMVSLFWLASQNERTRDSSASQEDAQSAIVKALYEIRRGDNIAAGTPDRDNDDEASNICAGGTFNKLSEKMVSVIAGTSQRVINANVFNTTAEATIRHAVANSPAAQTAITHSDDGTLTEEAWNEVRETVATELKDEFSGIEHIGNSLTEQRIAEYLDYENIIQYMTFESRQPGLNTKLN